LLPAYWRFVAYGLFFGSLVIMPLWLQTQLGYTATEAGKVMAPVGIFAILLSPVIGKLLPNWMRAGLPPPPSSVSHWCFSCGPASIPKWIPIT
jgi:hypothetical protein